MLGKNMRLILLMLLLLVIFLPGTYIIGKENGQQRFVVVMDVYHDPVLLNFSKAFEYLNESMGSRISLYKFNESLKETSLSGVAMYVIPPFKGSFDTKEKEIIKSYVERGGVVLILGCDYVKGRDFNPDTVLMDDVLSTFDLETKISFHYTAGLGNTIIDPFSNDSYLHIGEQQYTKSLKEFLGGKTYDLILESGVLTVETENISEERLILMPEQAYALAGDGTVLYFESGAVVFAMEKCGEGWVIVMGFSVSVSDLVEPKYNKSWIDIGENKDFWVALITKVLTEKQKLGAEGVIHINPDILWEAPIAVGVVCVVIGVLFAGRAPPKEERKVIKISEILKKAREKAK